MEYIKVDWRDFGFDDDNEGLFFGVQENVDFPDYCEWFKTDKEREVYIKKNKLQVVN